MAGFSIGNMFRPTQQTVAAPPQPGQSAPAAPAAPLPPGSTMQVQQPGVGNPNPPVTNGTADNSPLDAWKDVWHTDPKAQTATDPWSQPILPSDPNKIREAAGKMDMMAGLPPDLIQKVTAGNDPAALMDLMNRVAQNTLAMSAQLATASVERAGTVIRDRSQAALPEQFREFQLNNISMDNPVLNHPGAQGLLQMARQQLKMKNPNWNAQQIQDEAVNYLNSFATALSGSNNPKSQELDRSGTPAQDWESFLN